MADIITQPLVNGADAAHYIHDVTEPGPETPVSADTTQTPPTTTTPTATPTPVAPVTPPATVAAPKQTLREFATSDGYVVTDDPNKRMVYVVNPTTGKQISFGYGQGADYGVGFVIPGDGNTAFHEVDDIAKLENALGGPATPVVGGSPQPPTFEEATGLTAGETAGGAVVTPTTGETGPSIIDKPISFAAVSGPGQFTSAYTGELESILNDIKNSKFTYSPETDPLWQQAKTDITKSVKAAMNARGILGSTITVDRMTQVMASELPKYEARAYERYQGELNKLIDVFTMTMKMDERDYGRWVDSWEMNYKATVANWDRQNQLFNQNISSYNAALDKIDMVGYVDNETSIITGLSVGTLSKSEREYLREKADKVFFAKMEYNMNIGIEQWKFDQEKTLIDYKAKIQNEQTLFNSRVESAFQKELAAYDLQDWFTKADYEQKQAIQKMAIDFDYWKKEADYNQTLGLEKMAIGQEYDIEKMVIDHTYTLENKAVDSYYDKLLAKYKADLDADLLKIQNDYNTTGTVDTKVLGNNIRESTPTDAYEAARTIAVKMIGTTVNGKVVGSVAYNSATKSFDVMDDMDNNIIGAKKISVSDYTQAGLAMAVAGLAEKFPPAVLGSIFSGIANSDSSLGYQLQPFAVALVVLERINVPGDDQQTRENMKLLISNPSRYIPGDSVEQRRVLTALDALISLND